MVNNSSICHYEECNDEVIQTNISGLPRKIFDFSRNDRKAGFTLAETLIVVAVLGVIAMLTIPNLIKNQIEAQHRTKVKKSMTVYDLALSKIVVDNDIKNNSMLAQYAEEQKEANCEDTTKYFKKAKGEGCIFMTSDKVWHNIEDIRRPVISFEEITPENKDEITANANTRANKKAFVLVGHFDDTTGALRVNDLNFEKNNAETVDGNSSNDQVSKLFDFINNVKEEDNAGGNNLPEFLKNCDKIDDTHYDCDGTTFVPKTGDGSCTTKPFGGPLAGTQQCGTTDTVWVLENPISPSIYGKDAKNCTGSTYSYCSSLGDYYNAAKSYCESKGTHLATLGELQSLGYTNGVYWAAEEYNNNNTAYILSNGTVMGSGKNATQSVVCVGN